MPKDPDRNPVGRPHKAKRHDIVRIREEKVSWDGGKVYIGQYAVVLRWRTNPSKGSTWYKVVRITGPRNGQIFGRSKWVRSHYVRPVRNPKALDGRAYKYMRAWGTVEANNRMGERGCSCNCCVHVAYMKSEVLEDGTFKWE